MQQSDFAQQKAKASSLLNIIFSYPTQIENELERVHELLLDNEVDYFHLRKPDFDYIQFKDYIKQIDANYHYKIVIHDHYGLIGEFDLAGINLNKKSLNQLAYADEVDKCFIQPLVLNSRQIEVNRELPNLVTYSAHSLEEINALSFDTDYVFLSPIYDSISKEGYSSNFDLSELREKLTSVNTKVIALGGVKLENEEDLKVTGFYGMARLGDFWNNE